NVVPFRCCLLLGALLFLLPAGLSQDDAQKKTFFLPKSPTAAAYILNRLSNKELIEAPRSEFVYVALLERKGLDRKYRIEALEGLAKTRNTDTLAELLKGIQDLDAIGEESELALRDLAALLLQTKTGALAARRTDLEKLANEPQLPLTRQLGYAALMTADASADKIWQTAEADPAKLADLVLSVPLIRDAGLRSSLYPRLRPLLHKPDPAAVRRAAITAIA